MFAHAIDPDEALIVSHTSPPGGPAHREAVDRFYQELDPHDR